MEIRTARPSSRGVPYTFMAIATVNPATGELIKSFTPLTDSEIETKLQRAAAAFCTFRHLSFPERATMMRRAADILEAEKVELGRIMTLEMGKLHREAVAEAAKCAVVCRHYADHAEEFLADQVVDTGVGRNYIHYQPLGVILAVMPWNYPFWQVFRFIAPGIMSGNVGLLKHASNVPQCALKCEEIMLRAGFPEGVFQSLLIGASQVDAILNDPRVAAATLTGSEGAGIQVGVSAAKRVKKVVLELGGSDPFIVMPSADLAAAAATAVKARVINNGQSCIAAKRFMVHESIADEFEREFVRQMEALRMGDPMEASTDVGPLANADAVKTVDADVQTSVKAGARVLTGGHPVKRPGNFYPPTVITDIPVESPAYHEEMFAPVACLFRVKDAAEAIHIANDTRFGLGSSVWTNDPAERDLFVNEIEAGMVFVNKMVVSDPRLPFGGVKYSGHGREMGVHGIHEFVNIKTVCIDEPVKP